MRSSPLLILSSAYLLGLVLSFYKAQVLAIPVLVLVIVLLYRKFRTIFFFACILTITIYYGNWYFHKDRSKPQASVLKISGQVVRIEPYFDGCKILLRTGEFELYEITSKSACSVKPGYYCEFGLREKFFNLNPYGPSLEERLLSKGITGELKHPINQPYLCLEGEGPFFEKIRYRLFAFSENLSPVARGLFLALVLGVENQLPMEYLETLREQGLYHQLAISGFNLAVLYFLLYYLTKSLLKYTGLSTIGLPRQIVAGLLAIPGAGLVLILSGFQPSALRAFVFLAIYILSKLIFRNTSGFYILLLSAFLLTVISPNLVGNVSFQLSFVATLALILSGYFTQRALFKNKYIWIPVKSILMSLCVTLFTAPLVLKISGSIPIFSPINNLLYGSIWSFIYIPGAIFSALIAFANQDIAKFIMENLASVFNFFIDFPFPRVNYTLDIPYNFFLFALLTALMISLIGYKVSKKLTYSVGLFLIIYISISLFLKTIYNYYFLIIIPKFYNERAIIIKDRKAYYLIYRINEKSKMERIEVEPLLRKFGISKIDIVLFGNSLNEQSINTIRKVINKFDVGKIFFYEDLLSGVERIIDLNREIIPIDESMFLIEFNGLSILSCNEFMRKMLVPSGIEIIYTEKLSKDFPRGHFYIVEEIKRNSALLFLTEGEKIEVIKADNLSSDVLSWFLFPIVRPDRSETLFLQREFESS